MPPLVTATALSAAVSLLAYRRGSLSTSGVAGAIVVGALTMGLGGWAWGLLLAVFFVSSSLLSHFKEPEKRLAAEKFDKGHRRDLAQTLANGGVGALAALLSVLLPAPIWFPFFLGVMATVTADTWATELGTLSRQPPRLITTGRVAEVGTSGAISALGLAVSLGGGLLIGLVAALTQRRAWRLAAICACAGLAGSLLDSLLGATVQQVYYCDGCQKETERKLHKCGRHTRPLRGWRWLNNDLVNLLSSLAGGAAALALWLLWRRRGPLPPALLALCLVWALAACDFVGPATPAPAGAIGQATLPARDDGPTRRPVVTAAPQPNLLSGAANAYAYTELRDSSPQLLDPILARDAESQALIRNVMETLVYPHPYEGEQYIPLLASSWQISDDGRTATFAIRRGVRFSNGEELTASDVAYSLQRLLLSSPPGGSQTLLLQPLLGITPTLPISATLPPLSATVPISPALPAFDEPAAAPFSVAQPLADIVANLAGGRYVGDRPGLIANVPAAELQALCQQVQAAIVADDAAATVAIRLQQPWTPLLSFLSQPWAAAVSRPWAVGLGAWDGQCESWQNWYALEASESPLASLILGTGPYILDAWTPGAAYTLRANDGYWRGAIPMWQDGPAGPAALSPIRVLQVADDSERWQLLESGQAHAARLARTGSVLADRQTALTCTWVDSACRETNRPLAPLRRVDLVPLNRRAALLFNYDIPLQENDYVGSGRLDGEGIPLDFFADRHVRRAFAFCLDGRAYIQAGLGGDGFGGHGLLPSFISAAPAAPAPFPHLLRLCNDELAQAWDGRLPEVGFYLQMPYQTGNAAQQAAATILQEKLQTINPAYRLEPVAVPLSAMSELLAARRPPLALFSWEPGLPDAYYWLAPALDGEGAAFQQMPPPLNAVAAGLLSGLRSSAPAARSAVYDALYQFYEQEAPFLLLPEPTTTVYHARDLAHWFHNAADPLPYFYAFR